MLRISYCRAALASPNGALSPSGEASVPSFIFGIFLFRRHQLHLDCPNRAQSTARFRWAPGLRAFRECPIQTQSEEHATDLPFLRQFVPPEVWWVVEDIPAAIFCGQVYAPFGWLLPFRGLSSLRAFRNACEASSRERHLRVATFSSTLSRLGRRCYLEQILARGVSFSKSAQASS